MCGFLESRRTDGLAKDPRDERHPRRKFPGFGKYPAGKNWVHPLRKPDGGTTDLGWKKSRCSQCHGNAPPPVVWEKLPWWKGPHWFRKNKNPVAPVIQNYASTDQEKKGSAEDSGTRMTPPLGQGTNRQQFVLRNFRRSTKNDTFHCAGGIKTSLLTGGATHQKTVGGKRPKQNHWKNERGPREGGWEMGLTKRRIKTKNYPSGKKTISGRF